MNKLRLIFFLSLAVLVGVFIAAIFFVPPGESYPESRIARIIEGEDEWILQYDITNNEKSDIKYTIVVTVDEKVYRDSTVLKPGKAYTYIHHVYPHQIEKGKVTLALYEESRAEPVEQATYYVNFD